MATQQVKTKSQLLVEFPDNLQKLITAQDTRDLIVSAFAFPSIVDPSVVNDAFDTGHLGAFFDTGQFWWDSTALKLWFCASGQPAGAAQWKLVYPQTGGVGVMSVAAGQGTRTATGLPITATGTIWADQPLMPNNFNFSVVIAERGSLEVLGPAAIIATWPGVGSEFPSGWFLDAAFLTTTGVIALATADASSKFTGGGLAWLTAAAGAAALSSFTVLGGDWCRIVSDGTLYRVLGLPCFHGIDVKLNVVQTIAPGGFVTASWAVDATLWLGAFNVNPQQAFTNQSVGSFTVFHAPVIGIYRFHARFGFSGPAIGKVTVVVDVNGITRRTVTHLHLPSAAVVAPTHVTVELTTYMGISDVLQVQVSWAPVDGVTSLSVVDAETAAQFVWLGR